MVTLGDLAHHLDLSPRDVDPGIELDGIAPLQRAGSRDLAFIADVRYLQALRDTRAGCVIVKDEWRADCPVPALCAADPYLAYARVSALFDTQAVSAPGIHPTAVVDATATVPTTASVGAHAYIAASVEIGDNVTIGPGCFLGVGVRLGAGTRLAANVVLYHDVHLGEGCSVHGCTVIGSDGFGFARRADGWEKISQLGGVRIGDRVDIGAGCTIDRGALDHTVISNDVIIDNQVHLAHNCRIGERTAIAGCVGFAGSTEIGADCSFAGQVGVSGHLKICDNVHFTGQARVTRSISEPGTYASGTPLDTARQWGRNAVRFGQLDTMQRRLAALEQQLAELKSAASEDEGS
jgi:UDP-3-O-[3-hydroxymyristoyl] glucosamine N-acyltransferase